MKILSSRQMHELDEATLAHEGITSLALMERAASKLAIAIHQAVKITDPHFVVFCGGGNNGGDGLAMSRIMHSWGSDVDCYAIRDFSKYSYEYTVNYNQLKPIGILHDINSCEDIPTFGTNDIVIDAIFGSGLNRPVTGLAAQVIDAINAGSKLYNLTVFSVDVPSGLADSRIPNPDTDHVVEASHTFTIEVPFLSMLVPETQRYVGDFKSVSIGLWHSAMDSISSSNYLTLMHEVKNVAMRRNKFSHKGTFGHTLLLTGMYGKAGAAVLCSRACHRAGTGLLTTHVPARLLDILQMSSPETMVSVDSCETSLSEVPDLSRYNSIGVGPGIGQEPSTVAMIDQLLEKAGMPLVLDADALNIISANQSWLYRLPKNSILTPHPKEFERLFGKTVNSMHRIELLRENALKYGVIIVLKGAYTAVAMPDGSVHFNTTGNPGMATAGSGDALTGIIAALLAQGYSPANAAVMGVYVHGLAGDIAAEKFGHQGLVASDIIDAVPLALRKLLE